MMKKLVLVGVLAAISGLSVAQKAKVVSASNYLKKGELDKAKSFIDEALENESTSSDPKTWNYKFQIYSAIAQSQNIEYKALVPQEELLPIIQESFKKLEELDVKDKYASDLKDKIELTRGVTVNAGAEAYNEGNYLVALQAFAQAASMRETISIKDSLSYFYAAAAADQASQLDSLPAEAKEQLKTAAIETYKEAAKLQYNTEQVYPRLIYLLKQQGKDDEALNIIKEGRKIMPNDQALIIEELNYYLSNNQFDKALAGLELAVKNDPNNHNLYYAIGATFDNLANPTDAEGKDLEKPENYDELIIKAKYNYEKATQIKADYFDAYYNLGALLYNNGVYYNNKANELDFRKEKAKIEELSKISEDKFKEAMPILEKALELNPDDVGTKNSLISIYTRVGMMDKAKALKGN